MPTFSKSERLCSTILITKLFDKGTAFYIDPFKVIWIETPLPDNKHNVQILIGVSKKNIKKSVDRNRMKRLIKEAYRLNKHILCDALKEDNKQYALAVLFNGKQIIDFAQLQNKILLILHRLKKELTAPQNS